MSDAITRKEAYLKSIGDGTSSALKPITREEQYLAYIAGESKSFPTTPITREEAFLDKIAKRGAGGGGSSINVQPLNATANGTYDAPEGQAYDPVVVNVASGGGTSAIIKPITITENGTYNAKSGELGYNIEVSFKEVITEEDFKAYTAKATPAMSEGVQTGYDITDTCALLLLNSGDTTIYCIQSNSGNFMYTINASAMGLADGWKTFNGEPIDTVPTISIPEGATMSADLETTAVFFNPPEKIDAYAPITVNVKDTTVAGMIQGKITPEISISDDSITSVRSYAFWGVKGITSIDLPEVTEVSSSSFNACSASAINLPKLQLTSYDATIDNVFAQSKNLQSISLPLVEFIPYNTFYACERLEKIKLPMATEFANSVCSYCRSLTALILGASTVCTIKNSTIFTQCNHFEGTVHTTYNPDGLKDGYIYVPKALIEDYKVATNWSKFADQFRAIEDYPEITGG